MNKKKLRFIGIFILILSLSFPMIIVGLQDFRDINKEMTLENSQTEDILKKHPVIESIYQLYQNIPEKSEEYVIKRIGEYSEDKQAKLKEFQSYFSEEIQQLLILETIKIIPVFLRRGHRICKIMYHDSSNLISRYPRS